MNICGKDFSLYVVTFIFSLLLTTEAVATTEFYLFPNDVKQKVDCDFLEIKNGQALCTASNLLITHDLAKLIQIEVVNKGVSVHFQPLAQETGEKINELNSIKKRNQQTSEKENSIQTRLDFFPDFVQSLIDNFKNQSGNNILSTAIPEASLIIV